jgi:hypothetical protein
MTRIGKNFHRSSIRTTTFATSTRARGQADKLFREMIEIADDASGDYVTTSDGKRIVDHENINRSRLRVDARKWAAARLAPKKYGDHISHDVHGTTKLNFQPAILIKVGDGSTTEFGVPAASEASSGVLLDGNGDDIVGALRRDNQRGAYAPV